MNRYARQMILPEIGPEGQARLSRAHVLVVGAGGLGVPVLQYLAGAGVGPDHAGRWRPGGRPATCTASRFTAWTRSASPRRRSPPPRCAALNPDVGVSAHVDWLDPANAPALVDAADLVLDCADTFRGEPHAVGCLPRFGQAADHGLGLALSGYVAGCCGGAPSLRAIFPDLPERGATCATPGVMGPVVGTIGALQAQMALSVLLGLNPPPLGQLGQP
jgi:sulfur-carrier protein adenylyltransferase/sulfurtransferase